MHTISKISKLLSSPKISKAAGTVVVGDSEPEPVTPPPPAQNLNPKPEKSEDGDDPSSNDEGAVVDKEKKSKTKQPFLTSLRDVPYAMYEYLLCGSQDCSTLSPVASPSPGEGTVGVAPNQPPTLAAAQNPNQKAPTPPPKGFAGGAGRDVKHGIQDHAKAVESLGSDMVRSSDHAGSRIHNSVIALGLAPCGRTCSAMAPLLLTVVVAVLEFIFAAVMAERDLNSLGFHGNLALYYSIVFGTAGVWIGCVSKMADQEAEREYNIRASERIHQHQLDLVRDWHNRTQLERLDPPTAPGTPIPPATPGTPVRPTTPGTPVRPATPGTPVRPATPGTPLVRPGSPAFRAPIGS